MSTFGNTNGAWLAAAGVALIGMAGAAKGSRAGFGMVPYEEPDDPSQALVLRRRAEIALPDTQLASLIMGGGDVLGELSFENAARVDPRRIDALISQRMGQAFAQVMGGGPGPEAEMMYLQSVQLARGAYGGDLPTRAVVSLIEENLDRALFSTWPWLPPHVKDHIRDNLHVFDAALDDAVAIANKAARATRNSSDNAEWHALAEHLEGHKPQMRKALSGRQLGGPGGRHALPGRRRGLPGPRRR